MEISLEIRRELKKKFIQAQELLPKPGSSVAKQICGTAVYNEKLKEIMAEYGIDESDDFDYDKID